MSIYRLHGLHILRYIADSPIRRHFHGNKCIFKMSIRVPYSPPLAFQIRPSPIRGEIAENMRFWALPLSDKMAVVKTL